MWLYFRDDDLGWNPKEFAQLLTTFARNDQRLNAAAIPAILSEELIQESIPYSYQASPYLQIVTHGFSHKNYENEGRKCEYGPSRKLEEVRRELLAGREQLAKQFENYFPCFVPPWNRMEQDFVDLLSQCGYLMLSRRESSRGIVSPAPVPQFNVSIDFHKEKDGAKYSAKELFQKLARCNEEGRDSVGIMLHHSKMVREDFDILDELLKNLSKRNIQSVFFSDMLPGFERRAESEVSHV